MSASSMPVGRAVCAGQVGLAAGLACPLPPALPRLAGISSAARYLAGPHPQVGGDWYDLFTLPNGAIGVVVGDVTGHDAAAAAAVGQLRSVLRRQSAPPFPRGGPGSWRRIACTHGPRPRRYWASSKAPIRAWLAASVVGVPSW
jgi:hypothetical protein